MVPSPNVERWEILLPSQGTVDRHLGLGVLTPRHYHYVSDGVRDGACITLINKQFCVQVLGFVIYAGETIRQVIIS